MLKLLKAVARRGYLDRWPGDGSDLIVLLQGIYHLRRGALWAGIHALEHIELWHPVAIELLIELVSYDLLVNTAAELYYNAFHPEGQLLFTLGSILGPTGLQVQQYFTSAERFITRVVGLHYGERQQEVEKLKAGMPVFLALEPENKHDPHAIAVLSPWGTHLGYLRATLAAILNARYNAGEVFSARVVTVLDASHDANERLHIEVWRDDAVEAIFVVSLGK
ncbi:MAG: hypothetical protein PWQ18_477 [Clostridia bacterium]|nr:hypothetical protein [Clostridia bacterium]